MDIAGPKLKELHGQKFAIEEELSDAPVGEKIIGLHPASLREYEEQVRQLQVMFGQGVTPDYEEAVDKIRSLILRVTPRFGFVAEPLCVKFSMKSKDQTAREGRHTPPYAPPLG